MRELDAVRGIGRWTAEMFLIFKLGRTDVLPVDDLGLRKAAKRAYRLRKLPSRERFERLAVNWHPYSSISTLYLWRSTEKPEAPAKWKPLKKPHNTDRDGTAAVVSRGATTSEVLR